MKHAAHHVLLSDLCPRCVEAAAEVLGAEADSHRTSMLEVGAWVTQGPGEGGSLTVTIYHVS